MVDDEVDVTNRLKPGLESDGFLVEAYDDPIDALVKVKPNGYDLAIFRYPDARMNGFEL